MDSKEMPIDKYVIALKEYVQAQDKTLLDAIVIMSAHIESLQNRVKILEEQTK